MAQLMNIILKNKCLINDNGFIFNLFFFLACRYLFLTTVSIFCSSVLLTLQLTRVEMRLSLKPQVERTVREEMISSVHYSIV